LRFIGPLGPVYLLCEDSEGLVVLDQHAAHERVTFERLKKLYSGHHREIQTLLLPIHITLEPTQRETLEEHLDFFNGVGFELDLLAEETYVIRSVPAILVGASYEQVLRDAIDELAQCGHSERVDSAVDSVLSRMACHGSVRAGDRLNEASVKALLVQMDRVDFRGNCPHGRPVFFRFSWHELEKRFHRK
jgi:DNA mismatch repair protein MutL